MADWKLSVVEHYVAATDEHHRGLRVDFDDGSVALATVPDWTDRKYLAKALRSLAERLEASA